MGQGAITDLIVELAVIFTIFFIGYICRVTGTLTPDHAKGIGKFTARLALPALLFLSMATLDFRGVQFAFLWAFLVAKVAVCLLVAGLSLLFDQSTEAPLAAAVLRGVFSTLSNDFALGYPVLGSLFPSEVTKYLFLIAPVSLLVINPVAFSLIELSANRNGLRGDGTPLSLSTTIKKVLKNPFVFMVVLGIAFNFMVNHNPPQYIHNLFHTLGAAFTATALINLGGNMAGGLQQVSGSSLLAMMMTISAKTVLLPIIISVLLNAFGVVPILIDGVEYSLVLFGFILGTVPSAPGVYLFSIEFGILTNEIPAAVILCTLVSAPLMVVSAQLAELSITGVDEYRKLLQETSDVLGIVSLLSALVLLAMYLPLPKIRKKMTLINLPLICAFIIYFSSMLQTCYAKGVDTNWQKLRYVFIWVGNYGVRLSLIYNVIGLVLKVGGNRRLWLRVKGWLMVFFFFILVAWGVVAAIRFEPPQGSSAHDFCWIFDDIEPNNANYAELMFQVVLLATLLMSLAALVRVMTASKAASGPADTLLTENLLDNEENSELDALSSSDIAQEGQGYIALEGSKHDAEAMGPDHTSYSGSDMSYRDLLFVVYQCFCWAVNVSAVLWLVTSDTNSSAFAQVAFLDVFLATSQGLMILLIYGTQREYSRSLFGFFINLKNKATRSNQQDITVGDDDAITAFQSCASSFLIQHASAKIINNVQYDMAFAMPDLLIFVREEALVRTHADALHLVEQLVAAGIVTLLEGDDVAARETVAAIRLSSLETRSDSFFGYW